MKFTPRDYQVEKSKELLKILYKYQVAYLSGEVRTGKTLIALMTAKHWLTDGNLIIISKKKAISSINKDIALIGLTGKVFVINFESLKTITKADIKISNIKFCIIDEAHSLSQYPRPGKRTKLLWKLISHIPCLLMSGTPSPESYTQLFFQFWVTGKGPWAKYRIFYKWAHEYVDIEKKHIAFGLEINDYSKAKPIVLQQFNNYVVSLSQEQAGFDGEVVETVYSIPLPLKLAQMIAVIKKDKVLDYHGIQLTADTAAKEMSFVHQLSSGTVIDDDGEAHFLDPFKIDFIKKTFKNTGKKLAIFYVYVEEGKALRKAFKKTATDNPDIFNAAINATFICQVSAGREGVNLSSADLILFYNISYSAVSYWQARARSQTQKGGDRPVGWLFSDTTPNQSMEQKIYETVQSKKDYTLAHYKVKKHVSISKRK